MASPSKSRTNNLEIQYTKSPMVGGQLECLVGLTKHSLKNRPLTYVEDDIQLNVLIPNSMILGKDARTVNFSAGGNSDEWTKRQRYTAQKMKLSLRISSVNVTKSHLLKKSLTENFIFCAAICTTM